MDLRIPRIVIFVLLAAIVYAVARRDEAAGNALLAAVTIVATLTAV